jgi:hypothetical protein
MKAEIEFLQGAFESYKSQLLQEMDMKWSKKTAEMEHQHKEEQEKKIKEIRKFSHTLTFRHAGIESS